MSREVARCVRTRLPLSILAAIASLVLISGVVLAASIPGPDGVIHGCYDRKGDLKVVASLLCPKGYTALAWNRTGPTGPTGPQGPAGAVRAWALIQSTGEILRGSSVSSVTHPSAGVYCVYLTGIDVLYAAAVVTATGGEGGAWNAQALVPGCRESGVGGIQVRIWDIVESKWSNSAFSILVP